ncbi:MAG: hypothetical protein CL481_04010 [Acidobacteria bacterium]|jgi:hypothetical protein|nr:hypothetical protein [Acidobacteriota bacterium]
MANSAHEQYFNRIEEHFGRRRGGPLVLSPKDWGLVEAWHDSGIPLRIVLRGINQAFDRFAASGPRPDRINSLLYCEQEIRAAWEEYRATHQHRHPRGDQGSAGLPIASAHLRGVSAACRSAATNVQKTVASCLLTAAAELDEIERAAADGDLEARSVDRRANDVESRLCNALKSLSGTDELKALSLPPFSPYDA